MLVSEQRLWLTLGGVGVVLIGLTLLSSAWFPEINWSIGAALGGFMIIESRPEQRRMFLSLPRPRRALFLLAAGALVVLQIVLANRKMPAPHLFDIGEIAVIAALLLLYALFSRAMDALWLRFTRR